MKNLMDLRRQAAEMAASVGRGKVSSDSIAFVRSVTAGSNNCSSGNCGSASCHT